MIPRMKVMWSEELLDSMKLRDDEGNGIIIDIGEPGPDGYYTPRLTRDESDNPLRDLAAHWKSLAEQERERARKWEFVLRRIFTDYAEVGSPTEDFDEWLTDAAYGYESAP